ncbi:cysteine hydrolase family protein [Hydrogenispora ethanolica]|nr:isochorismatase family cysteine hydrolase [Hydrogenispora ethanolica]
MNQNQQFQEPELLAMARRAYESNPLWDVSKEDCALLVIDMQDEFVKPHWTPYWVPEATRQVARIKSVIEHFRANKLPVIYTVFSKTHQYLDRPKTGPFMSNRYPHLTVDQSDYFVKGEVYEELRPLPEEIVIHKPSYGAFFDTPLETILKNLGVTTVVICGTLTNYCCGTTARQAYERSYRVIFGSDITATDDPELQEAELKVLRKGFAMVLSAAEILHRLR